MEFVGAFPEGDWESLMSKMFSAEDMEFSSHFLSHHSYPNSQNTIFDPSNIDTRDINVHQSLFHHHSLESDLNPQYQISQESTSTNSMTQESYNYVINNNDDSYHINTDEFFAPNFLMDQNAMENLPSNSHHHLKRNIHEENAIAVEMSDQNPKKKPRVQRSKKSSSKAGPEKGKIEELENGNTSSNSSEDENTPQDNNGSSVVTLSGKARASRGSATDPQSLYARKRRERINERLKILQNIVPNGNKVDISTMLEEAVHYVKFLQLQIKLLSSDDMWMYAPIAYNGMDIGLTNKLSELV